MGYSTAVGFTSTDTTLEEQLAMHFAGNCYPRIPKYMIPVGVEAIHNVVEADAVEKLFLGAFVDGMLMDESSIEEE
jgi:hypothetical protein